MAVDFSEVSDGALVRRHLGGEKQAFEQLFDRYYARLFRLCLRRVGDRCAAEDIAQDTLVQALRYLDGFDPERPMWPWLKTIAGHLVGRFLKARLEEQSLSASSAAGAATVQDEADLFGEKDLLGRALSRLSPSQRMALVLRYFDGWSPQEMAELLGIRRHALEQLLFRARGKLREEYRRVSSEGRKRLGLVWPPALLRVRNRLRQWAASLSGENGLAQAGAGAAPLNPLIALLASAVAIGLLAAGILHSPKWSGDSGTGFAQPQVGYISEELDGPIRSGAAVKGSSRSAGVSTEEIGEGGPASASATVDVTKKSLRARLRAKLPGGNQIDVPAGVDTDAECDYSAVRQALCDAVDRLPDQD